MKAVTILLAALFATYMAWRGCRRGALVTVAGCVPPLLALGVLVLAAWRAPERLAVAFVIGGVAAAMVFVLGLLAMRAWRRRLEVRAVPPSHEPGPRRWLRRCDAVAGAALGLMCSAIACLGLACLGSTLPFAYSVRTQSSTVQDEPDDPPRWVAALGESCRTLAGLSDVAVLRHVPRLRDYGHEVRALVTILNAPPDQLKRLAEIHGITRLKDLPAVRAAVADDDYIDLFQRLRDGNLAVLSEITASPFTRELVESPEIRDLARNLTPSGLARDLSPPESDRDADSR